MAREDNINTMPGSKLTRLVVIRFAEGALVTGLLFIVPETLADYFNGSMSVCISDTRGVVIRYVFQWK